MLKILSAFIFVLSTAAFAQSNNSTTCRHEAYRYMSESEAYSFCQNVASNCFNAFFRSSGLDGARNTCSNVSSACFSKAIKVTTKEDAAKICSDVNNNCFEAYFPKFKNVRETIKRCSY
jgi:hypothetical protein